MKTTFTLVALSTAALVAGLVQAGPMKTPAPQPASTVPATPMEAPTAAPLSLADVHQRLLAAGYRDVQELERKRHHVEAEARDRDGRRVELELDPTTAAVRHSERQRDSSQAAASGLDLGQLLAQVEAAGYRAVQKIEREHDEVKVRAEDAQGQRVQLRLHPQTGAVTLRR